MAWGTHATKKDFMAAFRKTAGEWKQRIKTPRKKRKPEVLATVPSDSRPGKYYEIRIGKDNVVYCTCRGHKYHGHCKHVDRMMN